jgi:hypothetical protein
LSKLVTNETIILHLTDEFIACVSVYVCKSTYKSYNTLQIKCLLYLEQWVENVSACGAPYFVYVTQCYLTCFFTQLGMWFQYTFRNTNRPDYTDSICVLFRISIDFCCYGKNFAIYSECRTPRYSTDHKFGARLAILRITIRQVRSRDSNPVSSKFEARDLPLHPK